MLIEVIWSLLGLALLEQVRRGVDFAGLPAWVTTLLGVVLVAHTVLKIVGAHVLAARLGSLRWVALGVCFFATAFGAPSPSAVLSVTCGMMGVAMAAHGVRRWLIERSTATHAEQ